MNLNAVRELTISLTVTILISSLALLAWHWSVRKEGRQYAFNLKSVPVAIGMVFLFGLLTMKVPFPVVRKMAVWVLFIILLPMVSSDIQTHTIPKRYALCFPALASLAIAMYHMSMEIGAMAFLAFGLSVAIATISAFLLYSIPSVFDGIGYADFVGFAEMITLALFYQVDGMHLCIAVSVLSLIALLTGNREKGYAFVPVLLLAVPLGLLMALV